MSRESIADLTRPDSVGAELGVATGQFSARLLETGRFSVLYSIDAWAGGSHNTNEMAKAKNALAPYGESSVVIRSTFSDARDRFSDEFFDFIYIDGFAHTGQESGQTLYDWWPKLKRGGLFAGDDYDHHWPLVVQVVDRFALDMGREVALHTFDHSQEDRWGQSPSWWLRK